MPITYVSGQQTAQATATSITVTKPTGLADGDVLLAWIPATSDSAVSTIPSGWVYLEGARIASGIVALIYYKVVTDAASEPANYTWTGASMFATAQIAAYRGVDTEYPIDMINVTNGSTSGSSTTLTVLPTRDGAAIVSLHGFGGAATLSAPSVGTERLTDEDGVSPTAMISDVIQTTRATSTAVTVTHGSGAISWVAVQIALNADFTPSVSVVSTAVTSVAAATSIVATKPSGIQDGDLLIAHHVVASNNSLAITGPADWQVLDVPKAQSTSVDSIWFKVVTNAAGEPANYTWLTGGSASNQTCGIMVLRGVDTQHPIGAPYSVTGGVSGTSLSIPTISTDQADRLIVVTYSHSAAVALTDPIGAIVRVSDEDATSPSLQMATYAQGAAGNTPTFPIKPSASNAWHGRQFVVNPAPTTPPGITFISGSQAAPVAGTTITVTKPTGLQNGDVMIAHVVVEVSSTLMTTPSGWTHVETRFTSTSLTDSVFYKVVTDAASEPADYTFTTASALKSASIVAYRGVDNEYPIGAVLSSTTSSSALAAPSIITTLPSMVVLTYCIYAGTTLTNPPGTMVRTSEENALDPTSQVSDVWRPAGETTPVFTASTTSSAYWIARQLSLNAASVRGISFVGVTEVAVTAVASSITIPKPTGLADGDVLIAQIVINSTITTDMTKPAGWVQVDRKTSSVSLCTFYKVITNAAGEAADYTFGGLGVARVMHGAILAYRGVDPVYPIQNWSYQISTSVSASSLTVRSQRNALVLLTYGTNSASITMSTPLGSVLRMENEDANTPGMQVSDVWRGPGTPTAPVSTLSSSATWNAQQLVLNPIVDKPITFVSQASTINDPSDTSITIDTPAGIATGDLLLAVLASGAVTSVTPAGWTLAARTDLSPGSAAQTVYWRVVPNAATEPANHSFTWGSAAPKSGAILAYRGASRSNPVASMAWATQSNTTTFVAPSVTPLRPGLIVLAYEHYNNAATDVFAPPPEASVVRIQDGLGPRFMVAELPWTGIDVPTPAMTATTPGLLYGHASQIALNPAPLNEVLFVGAAGEGANGGVSVPLTVPAGTSDGDLMLALVVVEGYVLTMPAGWTILQSQIGAGGSADSVYVLAYRWATASEPASYTATMSGATDAMSVVASYRNVEAIDNSADQYLVTSTNMAEVPDSAVSVGNGVAVHVGAMTSKQYGAPPYASAFITTRFIPEPTPYANITPLIGWGDQLLKETPGAVAGGDWIYGTTNAERYGAIAILVPVSSRSAMVV